MHGLFREAGRNIQFAHYGFSGNGDIVPSRRHRLTFGEADILRSFAYNRRSSLAVV